MSRLRLLLLIFVANSFLLHAQTSEYIQVHASAHELMVGFLGWEHKHPEVMPADKRLALPIPELDMYASSGVLTYHGDDADNNAMFVRNLLHGSKETKANLPRPSLRDLADMFPELASQWSLIASDPRATIVSFTYRTWDHCKVQNDAIDQIRTHPGRLRIRIIEVQLHR
ncbi:MAG: hypothetical protein P4K97_07775 [Terracidiphilus sp.]|jgi:hypothetical protein|nr:hypothetical protein [Terracidiphilus sp.]